MSQVNLAFIDDSASEGSPPMFVLGGYVASAETWAAFSDDWRAALAGPPKQKYVKYIEAMGKRPKGQFYGWNRNDIFARMSKYRAIIEKHNLAGFSISFRVDHLRDTHATLPKRWLNPYYTAVAALMPELARALPDFGLPREQLDLIFDEQVMEKVRVLQVWEDLRRHAETASANLDPPDILTRILKNSPRWDNDINELPLQAADMQVTWRRMCLEAQRDGTNPAPMPGATRGLRQVHFTLDRDFFEARLARIARALADNPDEP